MILGYVDANDRAYDLGFATLRLKVRTESVGETGRVVFSQPSGAGEVGYVVLGDADVTVSLAMDHDGHPVPLLRPVDGHLWRHEGGLLFIADPKARDSEDPGFYLVQTRAMLGAVKFFFEDQGGRELLSVPRDEVLRVVSEEDAAKVYVSAANVALPKEKIAYAMGIGPASRAAPLLDGLVMSSPA